MFYYCPKNLNKWAKLLYKSKKKEDIAENSKNKFKIVPLYLENKTDLDLMHHKKVVETLMFFNGIAVEK